MKYFHVGMLIVLVLPTLALAQVIDQTLQDTQVQKVQVREVPRTYAEILGDPSQLTREELDVLFEGLPFDLEGYWLIDIEHEEKTAAISFEGDHSLLTVSNVTIRYESEDGQDVEYVIPAGRHIFAGEQIVEGVVYNQSTSDIPCHIEGTDDFTLGDFEMVIVAGRRVVKACSVSCSEGTYACCYYDDYGSAKCRCIANGASDPPDCDGGGPGSTDCSIGGGIGQHIPL